VARRPLRGTPRLASMPRWSIRRGAGAGRAAWSAGSLTSSGPPSPELQPDVIDLLFTVTSFETFDVLAGADKTPADAVPVSGTSPAPP
jgi:hypothetical protein